jgi:hypothetical protein
VLVIAGSLILSALVASRCGGGHGSGARDDSRRGGRLEDAGAEEHRHRLRAQVIVMLAVWYVASIKRGGVVVEQWCLGCCMQDCHGGSVRFQSLLICDGASRNRDYRVSSLLCTSYGASQCLSAPKISMLSACAQMMQWVLGSLRARARLHSRHPAPGVSAQPHHGILRRA